MYEFLSPARIVFGWGRRRELAGLVSDWGSRAVVVCGSRHLRQSGVLEDLLTGLHQAGISTHVSQAPPREPLVTDVDDLVSQWRDWGIGRGDFVIAIGGGSALDLAKAAAALITQPEGSPVVDYLEGVGRGLTLSADPLPWAALPTTSGTGSEATKNAVISSMSPPFKKSLRSDKMLARLVLVDPELTVSVPPQITAWTGLDALTQLLESYISCRARPIPQALALQGLHGFGPALRRAYHDPADRSAREHLAHAALLSGMALANSGLGVAHGVAAALGIHCQVPHGLACAVMLPAALEVNAEVKSADLATACSALTGRHWAQPRAAIAAGLELIRQLSAELQIPRRLSELGVTREQLPQLAAASRGNSLNGNPRSFTDQELLELLESLL